jgi:hypothetical protein
VDPGRAGLTPEQLRAFFAGVTELMARSREAAGTK